MKSEWEHGERRTVRKSTCTEDNRCGIRREADFTSEFIAVRRCRATLD
jgi:hypothetical protein